MFTCGRSMLTAYCFIIFHLVYSTNMIRFRHISTHIHTPFVGPQKVYAEDLHPRVRHRAQHTFLLPLILCVWLPKLCNEPLKGSGGIGGELFIPFQTQDTCKQAHFDDGILATGFLNRDNAARQRSR
jgi:hypothetical protein